MRFLTYLFVLGFAATLGCDGESSALMSATNTGGTASAGGAGGPISSGGSSGGVLGGQTTGGTTSGRGGSGGSPKGGSVSVPGGTRDLETVQCTAVSGKTCPVSSKYLSCLKVDCGTYLASCYQLDANTSEATGPCGDYATCVLVCPCDGRRLACEDTCLKTWVANDPTCSFCLNNLVGCLSFNGCETTQYCNVTNPAESTTSTDGTGDSTSIRF